VSPLPGDLLPELLDANLSQGVDELQVVEETIDMRELDGPENRYERTAMAELLAGTDDKKSRAYKAQRRNVERWAKGRKPMPITVRRIVSARRQSSLRLRAFRNHGANMRVQVSWYAERRREWLPPNRWITIPTREIREVIREWAQGRLIAAAAMLWREFLHRYNVPNIEDWERDVIVVDLRLEPAR
jgi:hypothetical protein